MKQDLSREERELVEACAEAAHDAWYAEKKRRLLQLYAQGVEKHAPWQLSWKNERGHEQLLPWSDIPEDVREFDRIVIGAIIGVLREKGYRPAPEPASNDADMYDEGAWL